MHGVVRKDKAARRSAFVAILSVAMLASALALPAQASHQPTYLDIEPETDLGRNGTTHVMTAKFWDETAAPIELSEGQLIDFEIISGPNANRTPGFRDFECPSNNPTVGATCTASYTDLAPFDRNNSTDLICAWISTDGDDDQYDPNGLPADGGDCDAELPRETETMDLTETVLKTWIASEPTYLDVEPESTTAPANTQVTLTANFYDQVGHPINLSEGQLVEGEIVSGPNADLTPGFRDVECSSNAPTEGGTCTITYTDGVSFTPTDTTDVICFWLSTDGDDDVYDPAGKVDDGGDCDVESVEEPEVGTDPYGNTIAGEKGNDVTDKVTVTWTVQTFTHERTIGLSFAHERGDLVVSGALAATDEYLPCIAAQAVKVQRRTDGKWDTKATLQTNEEGRYRAELADKTGRYRVVASKTTLPDADPSVEHVCAAAKAEKVHRH